MAVTVSDLMKLDVLQNAIVLAGQSGINNKVEHVNLLESREADGWSYPNMVLLATFTPLQGGIQSPEDLIRELHNASVSALIVKPKCFLEETPVEMLRRADEYALPLIEISEETNYSSVIHSILTLLHQEKEESLAQTVEIQQAFSRLLQQGGELNHIVQTLTSYVSGMAIIENKEGQILCYDASSSAMKMDISSYLRRSRELKANYLRSKNGRSDNDVFAFTEIHDKTFFTIAEIIMAQTQLGYITLIRESPMGVREKTALDNAVSSAALVLKTQNQLQEKKQFIQQSVFMDLLFSDSHSQESTQAWLDMLGWDINSSYVVAVIKAYQNDSAEQLSEEDNSISSFLLLLIKNTLSEAHVLMSNNSLIIVQALPSPDSHRERIHNVYSRLVETMETHCPRLRVTCYCGTAVSSLLEINESYHRALDVEEIANRISGQNSIYFFEDMEVFYFFRKYPHQNELIRYSQKYLGRIFEAVNVQFDLLATLEAYIISDCSIEKCAKYLYIHKNTLKYRLAKLREILDDPLTDTLYLYKLYTAIIIKKLCS